MVCMKQITPQMYSFDLTQGCGWKSEGQETRPGELHLEVGGGQVSEKLLWGSDFLKISSFYSFNELYFIYHKIHSFQRYNSILFSKFAVWYNHRLKSNKKHFHLPRKIP